MTFNLSTALASPARTRCARNGIGAVERLYRFAKGAGLSDATIRRIEWGRRELAAAHGRQEVITLEEIDAR
ncbi:hypothetical protein D1227_06230 [Henriciella mobilis]|uniref:hypothetical protein n=1 Tax=Henriciella mobilis TaxID=2305467 RepID=UPI000E66C136|nr:hypothetical protein [Henriciella mobilis]RIJ15991.1 hypothetical protein D1231_09370 [Henriciella mobilis]RIJ21201.1 hypothetical protein D1227_12910 [Henriciella mobilis]RIJ23098.1 hypothetical protein D1227_06230 [Henriciella mobilis]